VEVEAVWPGSRFLSPGWIQHDTRESLCFHNGFLGPSGKKGRATWIKPVDCGFDPLSHLVTMIFLLKNLANLKGLY
jgi:hypothetical protein